MSVAAPARPLPADKERFLVADRDVGPWTMALSVAATWIWAPALFVAAQQAYVNGLAGLAWFTIPNVLALAVFAPFAVRLRRRVPHGYTLSAYMHHRYDGRVHGAYLAQLLVQDVCAFAVQLVAGGAAIAAVTGWSYAAVVVVMAVAVLGYSLAGGLRASVFTDIGQMVAIAGIIVAITPFAVSAAGGFDALRVGLAGTSGTSGLMVALTFGIPSTAILLSGPFGFSAFWQRGWATREGHVVRAYRNAAWIFAVVPVGLGLIGLAAAGAGLAVEDPQLTNITAVRQLLPAWVIWPFLLLLLCGLVSTLDSALSAGSTVFGHDWTDRLGGTSVRNARVGMLAVGAAGTLIALIPGVTILYLWFFYGTTRSATFLPTVMTLSRWDARLSAQGVFAGIVVGLVAGAPVMIYGQLAKSPTLILVGTLTAVLGSAVIALLVGGGDRQAGVPGDA